MIAAILLVSCLTAGPGPEKAVAPGALVIATSRGEAAIPVRTERGIPALAAPALARLLPLQLEEPGEWARLTFGGRPFWFLVDGAWFLDGERVVPLAGGAYLRGDTLFLPLQWLTEYVPRVFHEAYRYDPLAFRFEEASLGPVVRSGGGAPPSPAPVGSALPSGAAKTGGPLRRTHTVVVDPGHGGNDPGNPGLAFPRGVREKDVTLALGRALKEALERRGIKVLLTRTADVRVDLRERAKMCTSECDLFVSLHVNSLPRRPGYQQVSGVETYFLDEARTAEAQRVAAMENEALRYETDFEGRLGNQLGFILKDLQANEYLRESAALADLVQSHAARVHPGGGRGVSQARFLVLGAARRPAILVETGFSTNPADARFLASVEGQRRLAAALAEGIVRYLAEYERKTDMSPPQ
jgi:N-acetylmuramoyl-L-alanine amidase